MFGGTKTRYEKVTKEKDKPIYLLKKKKKLKKHTLIMLFVFRHFCYDGAEKLSQIEACKMLEIMYKHQPQLFRSESFIHHNHH